MVPIEFLIRGQRKAKNDEQNLSKTKANWAKLLAIGGAMFGSLREWT